MYAWCIRYSVCNQPRIIPFKKLKSTGLEIGRGAYGRVFEVEYGKTRYAAKEVHSLLLEAAQGKALENVKANFLHECQIWSVLRHPRIVEIIGSSRFLYQYMHACQCYAKCSRYSCLYSSLASYVYLHTGVKLLHACMHGM